MTASFPLFLIPILPLVGAAFSLLFGKRAGKGAVTLVACGSIGGAMLVTWRAVWTLARELPPGGALVDRFFDAPWIQAGDLNLSAGLMLDHLSSILCLVVTGIGLLIHIYSTSYMEHDEGYSRFFGYLNLFTGAMLILVLGDSLPVTFIGWEGVGLCSYLLIGFWFENDAFAYAGRKAFVVNRIGDLGLLLAMFLLFWASGTLKYSEVGAHVEQLHQPLWFGLPVAYFIGLLVLVGATGKSAQIPLYVWLPDAMAGPTPVSALIHAATMVTAGVYVVARLHLVFELAPATLAAVAAIGALTALFAATIGFAQRDMKKVLAYSTISQLGFMFVGVGSYLQGTSNYHAGIFHLVTHAFFKAGLFLGAGSVMHALSGEGDITRMGGLKKYLPHTRWTFLLYCLAIAGIPPFAGFWSKDAVLAGAYAAMWPVGPGAGATEVWFATHLGPFVYFVTLAAAACTAFYMFRLYFLVFEGEFRGSDEQLHHIHESPPVMTAVLWILAVGSVVIGFFGIPDSILEHADRFGEWLSPIVPAQAREESAREFFTFAGIATLLSLAGIGAAFALYGRGFSARVRSVVTAIPQLYRLVLNKYYVDEAYGFFIVRPIRWMAFVLWKVVDTFIIDLLFVNGTGFVLGGFGRLVRYVQNGDAQRYVVGVIAGTTVVILAATQWPVREAAKFETQISSSREVTLSPHGTGPDMRRIRYRIAWDGKDFSQPEIATSFHHRYDSAGQRRIIVEALDPRWGTSHRESRTITIE
jgi:NADH-quinone oxidoreductase subunit L